MATNSPTQWKKSTLIILPYSRQSPAAATTPTIQVSSSIRVIYEPVFEKLERSSLQSSQSSVYPVQLNSSSSPNALLRLSPTSMPSQPTPAEEYTAVWMNEIIAQSGSSNAANHMPGGRPSLDESVCSCNCDADHNQLPCFPCCWQEDGNTMKRYSDTTYTSSQRYSDTTHTSSAPQRYSDTMFTQATSTLYPPEISQKRYSDMLSDVQTMRANMGHHRHHTKCEHVENYIADQQFLISHYNQFAHETGRLSAFDQLQSRNGTSQSYLRTPQQQQHQQHQQQQQQQLPLVKVEAMSSGVVVKVQQDDSPHSNYAVNNNNHHNNNNGSNSGSNHNLNEEEITHLDKKNMVRNLVRAFIRYFLDKTRFPLLCQVFFSDSSERDTKVQFRQYFTDKKFNNLMLKLLIQHETYGIIFQQFLQSDSLTYLKHSHIKSKENHMKFISYLCSCFSDPSKLESLETYTKTNKKQHHQSQH